MDTLITELFDCLFDLPENFFDRPRIRGNIEKQEQVMEEIMAILPEEKKKLIYEYEVALHDAMQDEVLEAFRQGIKIGFRLKKELQE